MQHSLLGLASHLSHLSGKKTMCFIECEYFEQLLFAEDNAIEGQKTELYRVFSFHFITCLQKPQKGAT